MADGGLQLSHGVAAAVGLALAKVGHMLWGALTASRRAEDAAKEVTIATLRAELAHERAERERERRENAEAQRALGDRLDDSRAALNELRDRAAGMLGKMRLDPTVDDMKFESDMPTVVRNRAELLVPKKSTPPKGTPVGRYRGPER